MDPNQYKAVVFDMDETLLTLAVDWSKVKAEIAIFIKQNYNLDLDSSHFVPLMNSISDRLGVKVFREAGRIAERHEVAGVENATPVPHAISFLKQLHKQEKKLFLYSSNSKASVTKSTQKFDIGKYFTAIVSREDVSRIKPDPQGLKLILSKFKLKPEDVLFIGDSKNDESVAKSQKVAFLHVAKLPK